MENYTVFINGVARQGDEIKSIIINDGDFAGSNVKELVYSTEYGDVEALIGFEDLDIVDVDANSDIIRDARVLLCSDESVQAIVFVKSGFLIITDLIFFSAYTKIDGKETPYVSTVESHTYEEDEASDMIYEDIRLS